MLGIAEGEQKGDPLLQGVLNQPHHQPHQKEAVWLPSDPTKSLPPLETLWFYPDPSPVQHFLAA